MSYRRVAIKLSGELFMGSGEQTVDPEFLKRLSQQLKSAVETTKAELVVIIGGGNIMRGVLGEKEGLTRTTADYMGITATVINGMALVDALKHHGQAAKLVTKFPVSNVETFRRDSCEQYLDEKNVVVVAGGTGNPFVTTDTAVVINALELKCDAVLKATKVDGVYDKDPVKFSDATKMPKLTYKEAVGDSAIAVMDHAAIAIAQEHNLPIVVFDLLVTDNIQRIIDGEEIGSIIS
jgi:uridylate kinase